MPAHNNTPSSVTLQTRLDLEGILLSTSQSSGPQRIAGIKARLKRLVAETPQDRQQDVRYVLHGFLVKAVWKAVDGDEFLELNIPWKIDVDDYLDLASSMQMEDHWVAWMHASHSQMETEESLSILETILVAEKLTPRFVDACFRWTISLVLSLSAVSSSNERTERARSRLIEIWEKSLHLQKVRQGCVGETVARLVDKARLALLPLKMALRDLERALSIFGHIFHSALDIHSLECTGPDHNDDGHQECARAMADWDSAFPTANLGSSHASGVTNKKQKRDTTEGSQGLMHQRLDRLHLDSTSLRSMSPAPGLDVLAEAAATATVSSHEGAFVTICRKIRYNLESSDTEFHLLTKTTDQSGVEGSASEPLVGQFVRWVDSLIERRSRGWQSVVKVKVQFYDIFPPPSVNAHFAGLITLCNLQWELCSTLVRFSVRLHEDPKRLSPPVMQLGCELLLAVFTEQPSLRTQIRDYLHVEMWKRKAPSVTAGRSKRLVELEDPLFGSWDLWMMNVDQLLVATLNQLVATNDAQMAVPPQVIESLVKLSLIAPCAVMTKILIEGSLNRGQGQILLVTLTHLGQLTWLRRDESGPTLFCSMLRKVMQNMGTGKEGDIRQLWSPSRRKNMEDMITLAMTEINGKVLLHADEFIRDCAIPLLQDDISKNTQSPGIQIIAAVFANLYQLPPISSLSPASVSEYISSDLEWRRQQPASIECLYGYNTISSRSNVGLLIAILRLRTIYRRWSIHDVVVARELGFAPPSNKVETRCNILYEECLVNIYETVSIRLLFELKHALPHSDERFKIATTIKDLVRQALSNNDIETKLTALPFFLHQAQDETVALFPREITLICPRQDSKLTYRQEYLTLETVHRQQDPEDTPLGMLIALGVVRLSSTILDEIRVRSPATDATVTNARYRRLLALTVFRLLSVSSKRECNRLLGEAVPVFLKAWGGLQPSDVCFFRRRVWGTDKAPPTLMTENKNKDMGKSHFGDENDPVWAISDVLKVVPESHKGGSELCVLQVFQFSETIMLLAQDTRARTIPVTTVVEAVAINHDRKGPEFKDGDSRAMDKDEDPSNARGNHTAGENQDEHLFDKVDFFHVGHALCLTDAASILATSFKALKVHWSSVSLDLLLACFALVAKFGSLHIIATNSTATTTTPSTLTPAAINSTPTQVNNELILLAMNLADEIVKRQESHEGNQHNSPRGFTPSNTSAGTSSSSAGFKQSPRGRPDRVEDEATRKWRESLAKADQRTSSAIGTMNSTPHSLTPARRWTSIQLNCLTTGLDFLPPQEQQALRSRLQSTLSPGHG